MSIRTLEGYDKFYKIITDSERKIYYDVRVSMRIGDDVVRPYKVVYFKEITDYVSKYFSYIFITLTVDFAVYTRMVRNPDKIYVDVFRHRQSPNGQLTDSVDEFTRSYSGLINGDNKDHSQIANAVEDFSVDGDSGKLINITLQLVPDLLKRYRLFEVGGIFKNVTVEEVLKVLMIPSDSLVTAGENLPYRNEGIYRVDIAPPDNTHRYKHIMIPTSTRIDKLPNYLQERYGLYSAGVGWHIHNSVCYIYPLLDYTDKPHYKDALSLTVLNIPGNEAPILDCAHTVEGNELVILANRAADQTNNTENLQANNGTGIRFVPSSILLDKFSTSSNNRSVVDASKNVKEFIVDLRDDNLNNIKTISGGFTDNIYKHTPQLVASLGTRIKVEWDRSAPELIFPGMKVRYLYKQDGFLTILAGTVLGIDTAITPTSDSFTDKHYITTTVLDLYVKRINYVG